MVSPSIFCWRTKKTSKEVQDSLLLHNHSKNWRYSLQTNIANSKYYACKIISWQNGSTRIPTSTASKAEDHLTSGVFCRISSLQRRKLWFPSRDQISHLRCRVWYPLISSDIRKTSIQIISSVIISMWHNQNNSWVEVQKLSSINLGIGEWVDLFGIKFSQMICFQKALGFSLAGMGTKLINNCESIKLPWLAYIYWMVDACWHQHILRYSSDMLWAQLYWPQRKNMNKWWSSCRRFSFKSSILPS